MKVSEITYKRIDVSEVKRKLTGYIKSIKRAKSAAEIVELINRIDAEFNDFTTMTSLAYIRNSINVNDIFYVKEQEFLDKVLPKLGVALVKLNNVLLNSKHLEDLKKLIAPVAFKNLEMSAKCINRRVILPMIKENTLCKRYYKVMSNLKVTVDGNSYNASSINKLFTSSDRELRHRAMIEYGETLKAAGGELDEIYDSLVKTRAKIASRLSMADYVEFGYNAMNRNCYDRHDIAGFRANVKKHIVPLVCEIKNSIADKYGWDKIAPYDEEIYTDAEPVPQGTSEELLQRAAEMYREVGPEAGKLFDEMMKSEAFDVLCKDGKQPGGYCTTLDSYKLPYIFANFNGSADDVETLTHEFGHALAAKNSFNFNMFENRPTYEACEVHSMSMEFLTYPWMKGFFGERTDDFMYYHIANRLSFIPYGTIVDAFQHAVYEKPNLTPEQRNEHWSNLEREYQPYKSNEGVPFIDEGRRWQLKHHFFDRPFYYIDYCLAQIIAFQIFIMAETDHKKAFSAYMKFLKPAGTMSFLELVSHAGLKSPFEEETFIEICSHLRKLLLS